MQLVHILISLMCGSIYENIPPGTSGQQILGYNLAVRYGSCSTPDVAMEGDALLLTVLVYTYRVNLTSNWRFVSNITMNGEIFTPFAMTTNIHCYGLILVDALGIDQTYDVSCSQDETYMYFYVNRAANLYYRGKSMIHSFKTAHGEATSLEHTFLKIVESSNERLIVNGLDLDAHEPLVFFMPYKPINFTYCVYYIGTTYMSLAFNGTKITVNANCTYIFFNTTMDTTGMGIFVRSDEKHGPCLRLVTRYYVMVIDRSYIPEGEMGSSASTASHSPSLSSPPDTYSDTNNYY
ncbi:hypothetical protein BgiBS90_022544, partial [Biomphalaria glabrata]